MPSCCNIRIPCISDFITIALFQTDGGWVSVRTLEDKQQETSKVRKRKRRFTQSCAISVGNGGTVTRTSKQLAVGLF